MPRNEKGKSGWVESHYRSTLVELGEQLRQRRDEIGIKTQTQMARITGLEQWTISRIESGLIPKDRTVLHLIAQGYRFDEQHVLEVVFGFKPEESYYNPLLVAYRLHERQLYDLRIGGHPQSAINHGMNVVAELRQAIRQVGSSNEAVSEGLTESLFSVLTEIGWSHSETAGSREDWFEKSSFMTLLHDTYEELGAPELLGLVHLYKMDGSYVGEQYRDSLVYSQEALSSVAELNSRLQIYKTILMNWAYLRDQRRYLDTTREVWSLLDKRQYTTSEIASGILQAMTRGAVMLDMPEEAGKASRANKRLLMLMKERGINAPIRRPQLVRAELEQANHFREKKSEALVQAGNNAYRVARRHYPRLAAQIQAALY